MSRPNTVLQVFQSGFTIEDRVLRPAMVVVSTAAPKSEPAPAPTGQPSDAMAVPAAEPNPHTETPAADPHLTSSSPDKSA